MKGVCKICGCDDEHACMTDNGPCSWVTSDLCSACIVEMAPGTHTQGKGGLIVEKCCKHCDQIETDPEREGAVTCSKDHFNPFGYAEGVWFAWSGIKLPNKRVAAAQKHCSDFAVHKRFIKQGGVANEFKRS